jgi:hypothetical protein
MPADSTRLLASYCTDPKISERYNFIEIYGFASHGPLDAWIRGLLGKNIPLLSCGISSGVAAVEVALHLGATSITTVGSDLAIIDGSRYAFCEEKGYHELMVEGVKGNVPTQKDLMVTARTMSYMALANHHICRFTNCGEGAFLSGWGHRNASAEL